MLREYYNVTHESLLILLGSVHSIFQFPQLFNLVLIQTLKIVFSSGMPESVYNQRPSNAPMHLQQQSHQHSAAHLQHLRGGPSVDHTSSNGNQMIQSSQYSLMHRSNVPEHSSIQSAAAYSAGFGVTADPSMATAAHQYHTTHNPFASCQYSGYGQGELPN